ncbi:MAG: type II toxin-antitoxin system Phd/YefM family antitoxin [Phycisphaerae bacterium]
MKFITIRELRSKGGQIRKDLAKEKEMILTVNGLPFALLSQLRPESMIEDIIAIRRAKAHAALKEIRADAKSKGLDKLTMGQIDEIIAETRKERRSMMKGR